ncbi:MAG: hypothetical protein MUP21_15015 [Dehalococcoidia bacterium]|nr:hypothetical protein [Dehalococcoidia bacterium]
MWNIRKGGSRAVFVLIALLLLIMALALVTAPVSAQNRIATARRTIETVHLVSGESTEVDVAFTSLLDEKKSFAIRENVPTGWTLTRISDDASAFQSSSNTWVWFSVDADATKIVTYSLTVPEDAAAGSYEISGMLTAAKVSITITGDTTITVQRPEGDGILEPTISPTDTTAPTTVVTASPMPTPVLPTPTVAPTETPSEEGGTNVGAIVGGIIAVIAVILIAYFVMRRRGGGAEA